jgi:hypothetical protein
VHANAALRACASSDPGAARDPAVELIRRDCLKTLRGTVDRLCEGTRAAKGAARTGSKTTSQFQAFEMWHACRLLRDRREGVGDPLLPTGDADKRAMRRLQSQLRAAGMRFANTRRAQPEMNKASKRAAQVFRRRRDQIGSGGRRPSHVARATTEADGSVALRFKGTTLRINAEHFAKLRDMWTALRADVSDGAKGGPCDEAALAADTFCLVQRYASLIGFHTQGAGFQAAMHLECFEVLRRDLDCRFECFASPLNARYRHFCSAFADTDGVFGSLGSFFRLTPDVLVAAADAAGGPAAVAAGCSFEANPPFVPEVIDEMATHIHRLLKALSPGGACAPTEMPLSFVVIVPEWRDCRGHELMRSSKQLRGSRVLGQKAHGYCEGAQHLRGVDSFRIATQATSVFVLQNEAGARRWPVREATLDALEAAFAAKHARARAKRKGAPSAPSDDDTRDRKRRDVAERE